MNTGLRKYTELVIPTEDKPEMVLKKIDLQMAIDQHNQKSRAIKHADNPVQRPQSAMRKASNNTAKITLKSTNYSRESSRRSKQPFGTIYRVVTEREPGHHWRGARDRG